LPLIGVHSDICFPLGFWRFAQALFGCQQVVHHIKPDRGRCYMFSARLGRVTRFLPWSLTPFRGKLVVQILTDGRFGGEERGCVSNNGDNQWSSVKHNRGCKLL
jgi:hypothetical protein